MTNIKDIQQCSFNTIKAIRDNKRGTLLQLFGHIPTVYY